MFVGSKCPIINHTVLKRVLGFNSKDLRILASLMILAKLQKPCDP